MSILSESDAGAVTSRTRGISWNWFYLLLLVPLIAVVAFNLFRPVTVLPRITLAPGYAMMGTNGEPVVSEDFRGRLVLYSFSHSRCDDHCAVSGADLAALWEQLSPALPTGSDLTLVTISLNPQVDTPERLATYVESLTVESSGSLPWVWLTGDELQTRTLVGTGFGVYYRPQEDGSVRFGPHMVLVDGLGVIRAEYRNGIPSADLLRRDVNLVLEEVQNSEGATRLAYEAAHLFLCYPR